MKRFHRCVNLYDIDINPWVTTSDYRFYTNDIYDNRYKNSNLAKSDYIWGVHDSFISSSFFITSFDTRTILYPELYFKYISQMHSCLRLAKMINFFSIKNNINFYTSILDSFKNKIFNTYKKEFINFYFIKDYKIIKFLKVYNFKINILKKNISLLVLLFNITNNVNNNIIICKNQFYFSPSKVKNSILLKNYFYFRAKRYKNKTSLFMNFRLSYLKRIPKININSRGIISYSLIYLINIFKSIYYKFYNKFIINRLNKFWSYFFTFFLQNIKKRFYFFNIYIDNLKEFNIIYAFDLLLFLHKFFYFNIYLKKYFNGFIYIKKIKEIKKLKSKKRIFKSKKKIFSNY